MHLEVRVPRLQVGILGQRFLDPVLAEHPVTGGDHRLDALHSVGLADRHEGDVVGRAAAVLGGFPDPRQDGAQAVRSAGHILWFVCHGSASYRSQSPT
jgi:hypothetical protein